MHSPHRTAAILSVGDELTLGQTLDTNSAWLSERLRSLGIVPVEHVTVPDAAEAQRGALLRLGAAVDLIVSSGGLGPTADDLTRQALAAAMGQDLVEDPVGLAQVEAWFSARSRTMPAINRTQALRPRDGLLLPNLHGTAPGLAATLKLGHRSCDVFCLPGPPSEMKPMWDTQVVPRLRPDPTRVVRTRVLACFGIGESDLATRLGPLMDRTRNPLVGTTASGGVVSCRIRFEGSNLDAEEAQSLLDQTAAEIRRVAGDYVFGEGETTLPEAVLRLAGERSQTIGCVESCTGGLLGALLTSPPGSSAVFQGGLLTYSNELKTRLADVPAELFAEGAPGAVSPEVAGAMAQGGLERLGVDHCLAITGIAGPGGAVPARGSTPAKPVGTVFIARASRQGLAGPPLDVRQFRMSGDRATIRDWSAKCALAMLRLALCGLGSVPLLREVARPAPTA